MKAVEYTDNETVLPLVFSPDVVKQQTFPNRASRGSLKKPVNSAQKGKTSRVGMIPDSNTLDVMKGYSDRYPRKSGPAQVKWPGR